jgi:hypothetical protein
MKRFLPIAAASLLAACATVDVQPLSPADRPKVVYIEHNAAADDIAPDLESAIENGFQRHGIGTKEIDGEPPSPTDYALTYAATGGWDLKPYVKTAELRLKRGFKQVGFASYISGPSLNTTKFESAHDKVDPLLDQLLAGFR